MSLYNMLFGINRVGPLILAAQGVDPAMVPRLRDAYITDDGKVAIFARVGDGNREGYAEGIAYLTGLPGYIRDEDARFDSTYATFFYEPSKELADLIPQILEAQGHYDPMERFERMLGDMKSGADTPDTRKAFEVGKKIIAPIKDALDGKPPADKVIVIGSDDSSGKPH